MIVPRNRLLIAVSGLLPLLVIPTFVPDVKVALVLLLIVFAAIAILDSLLAPARLRGISLHLPEIVRLSKDRPGEILIQIGNASQRITRLRIGLPFPPEIIPAAETIETVLLSESVGVMVSWSCKPVKRGKYVLSNYYIETVSPLGLWSVRSSSTCYSELRVYPNLLEERKKLAAIFLNRGVFGIHAQRLIGQGREFEKLREYVSGDSYDQIHWKATARRGRPVTKVFQVERTQEVYVVIDSSRLTAREVNEETVLEQFVKSALILGLVAQQQGDLFGVLTFSDRIQDFVRAGNGKAHYSTCRDALYTLQPHVVTPDYDEVCSFLRLRLRRRALLVILTDLNDPILSESFVHSSRLLAQQHLVLVNIIRPALARQLFSEPAAQSVDSLYQKLGGHLLWQNLRELENILHRQGIRLTQMEQPKMSAELISQYLSIKQRQIL
jgi:uncharacterized protein (DUF58 family)